ncbi:MAG: hypothetical protein JWN74_2969 [Acidobacteriaceae bacterium]|nr:hypothetical protein [Acidobacteriaceae bacterium]
MKKSVFRFSLLLPILNLVFAAGLVFIPALLFYFRLKGLSHGASGVMLQAGEFQLAIPSNNFFNFSFQRATLSSEMLITVLNAPAAFINPVFSSIGGHGGYWYPDSLGPAVWRWLSFPIFAIPAWAYAGRGIDDLFRRKRVGLTMLISSVLLTTLALVIWGIIRFGLLPSEHQSLTEWFMVGFALWTLLFATPFAAWLRQQRTKSAPQNQFT